MKYILIIILFLIFTNCSDSNISGSEAGNAKISAYLYYSNNNVAGFIKVDLYNSNGDTLISSSNTDSLGYIEFKDLSTGNYQLYTDTIGEILLETVEANSTNPTVNLYFNQSAFLIVQNILIIDSNYSLSLINTPINNIAGKSLNDSTIIYGNIPAGNYTPAFKYGNTTVTLDSILSFNGGDTITINKTSISISDNIFQSNFTTLAVNDNSIFLGTTNGGLLIENSKIQYLYTISQGGEINGDTIITSFMTDSMLYIGTDSGITVIKNGAKQTSYSTGKVYSINKNSSNHIFVCSHYDGVGYLINETYIPKLPDSSLVTSILPYSTYSYSDSSIIIGTRSRGLYFWEKSSGLVLDTSYIGWNSLYINRIEVSSDSSIWLVTPSSLRRKLSNDTWEMYHNDIGFYASITDKNGDLWFGANNGELYKWNGSELKLTKNLESKIVAMTIDSMNNLYCLTEEKLFILN